MNATNNKQYDQTTTTTTTTTISENGLRIESKIYMARIHTVTKKEEEEVGLDPLTTGNSRYNSMGCQINDEFHFIPSQK